jgi:hypothetical protein
MASCNLGFEAYELDLDRIAHLERGWTTSERRQRENFFNTADLA